MKSSRKYLKLLLSKLTLEQQIFFKKLYFKPLSTDKSIENISFEEVVDLMKDNEVKRAIQQAEQTLKNVLNKTIEDINKELNEK